MSIRSRLLRGVALLMASFSLSEAQATTCAVPPTCQQMGYTMKKADCGENPVLRCPFALSDDNQVYCGELSDDTGNEADVGAILYGDGSVSKTLISNKTPIGIVFDMTNRLAVALQNSYEKENKEVKGMAWMNNPYSVDGVPNLELCPADIRLTPQDKVSEVIACAVDGRANTDKILACGNSCGGTPAATACNLYEPKGCTKDFCKKGKWFLPSMRDLYNINLIKNQMNVTLDSLKYLNADNMFETTYGIYSYYSSNLIGKSNTGEWLVWVHYAGGGQNIQSAGPEHSDTAVRPVVKF